MELDHIVPGADGGPDTIENAIPLCFDCHAEVHAYNPKHPRGRRFTPEELRAHKEQWLGICRTHPEVFTEPARDVEVGPVQALIDELDFNWFLARDVHESTVAPPMFAEIQFRRAIAAGALSMLDDQLKVAIHVAYREIATLNAIVRRGEVDLGETTFGAQRKVPWFEKLAGEQARKVEQKCAAARDSLLQFLSRE